VTQFAVLSFICTSSLCLTLIPNVFQRDWSRCGDHFIDITGMQNICNVIMSVLASVIVVIVCLLFVVDC
jgi:hypothetical protein